jgi:transcriptional antiterminator RfaH
MPSSVSSSHDCRWYVVATTSQAEQRACDDIQDLGYPTFLPLASVWRVFQGYRRRHLEPLFRGYIFVQLDLDAPGWGRIIDSKRVRHFLPCNEAPRALDDGLVEHIRLAERMGAFDRTRAPEVGIAVEVIEGPYANIITKIIRARAEDRVDVLLRMFGAERVVTLPLTAVREV